MGFDYIAPRSIGEAISILGEYDGKAKVIAGGTDLLMQIRNKEIAPEYIVDITGIAGLDCIRYDGKGGLKIGGLTTIRVLETSTVIQQRYPIISEAAKQLGSMAIRNVATIGGNLCNAAPSAESAPALIALSGVAKIVGRGGERVVPLEGFFTGPGGTILKRDELLVEIHVPIPSPNTRGVYLKHSMRGTIDLAIVNIAVIIALGSQNKVCEDIKIALGAVAPTPIRMKKAEDVMRGKRMDEDLVNRCAQVASEEARPISDVRASAEYRKEMVKVFTKRAVREALTQPL
jgi:carbon-monoxide dehydrogenase medium subunit